MKVKVKLLSRVRLFATPWTVAHQDSPSMNFLGKSTGVGCHFLLQGIFSTRGLNTGLPHCGQTLYCLSQNDCEETSVIKSLWAITNNSTLYILAQIAIETQLIVQPKLEFRVWERHHKHVQFMFGQSRLGLSVETSISPIITLTLSSETLFMSYMVQGVFHPRLY